MFLPDDSSLHRLDPQNVDHLFMRFYVEGERGKATVRLEMTKVRKLKGNADIRVKMTHNIDIAFYLLNLIHVRHVKSMLTIVPGFAPKRIYLENVADRSQNSTSSVPSAPTQPRKGFLGVQWGFGGDTKK
jgi:hypothetical protein